MEHYFNIDTPTDNISSYGSNLNTYGLSFIKVPNVYNGDIPIISFGDNIGALWGTGGKLSFIGAAEESANVFFANVISRFDQYLVDVERAIETKVREEYKNSTKSMT
jgi:hypothetical protein